MAEILVHTSQNRKSRRRGCNAQARRHRMPDIFCSLGTECEIFSVPTEKPKFSTQCLFCQRDRFSRKIWFQTDTETKKGTQKELCGQISTTVTTSKKLLQNLTPVLAKNLFFRNETILSRTYSVGRTCARRAETILTPNVG